MRVTFPAGQAVTITHDISRTEFARLRLAYCDVMHAQTDTGNVILQHYQSSDFIIGYQLLFSPKPTTLNIQFDKPLLMLSYLLDGAVSYLKSASAEASVLPGTYHLCYENAGEHPLHLSKGYLENFFIILSERYLEKLENPPGQVQSLLEAVHAKSTEPLHSPFYKISSRIRKAVRDMLAYKGDHANLFLQSKVNELLLYYLGSVAKIDIPQPIFTNEQQKLEAITECIGHALDRTVTVSGLARRFNFSVTELHKKFKKAFGISPYKYIQEQRMQKAKELLTGTQDLKTGYIASLCGYEDLGNFCNAFKKRFGHTTSYFRIAARTLR